MFSHSINNPLPPSLSHSSSPYHSVSRSIFCSRAGHFYWGDGEFAGGKEVVDPDGVSAAVGIMIDD